MSIPTTMELSIVMQDELIMMHVGIKIPSKHETFYSRSAVYAYRQYHVIQQGSW